MHCCDPGIPAAVAARHRRRRRRARRHRPHAAALGVHRRHASRTASPCMPGACRPMAAAPCAAPPTSCARGWHDAGMSATSLRDLTAHPGLRAGRTHTRGGLARSTRSGRRGRGMVRTSRELTAMSDRRRHPHRPQTQATRVPWQAKYLAARAHLGLELPADEGRPAHAWRRCRSRGCASSPAPRSSRAAAGDHRRPAADRRAAPGRHLAVSGVFLTALPFSLFALARCGSRSALAGIGNATTPLAAVFFAPGPPAERPAVAAQARGRGHRLRRRRRHHAAVGVGRAAPTCSASA